MAPISSENMSGGWKLLKFERALDFDTVTEIKPELVSIVTESESGAILDMSGIDFVDSSGIGFLVLLHKAARGKGLRFVLANLRPQAVDLLDITHLNEVFETTSDIEGFIESASGGQSR